MSAPTSLRGVSAPLTSNSKNTTNPRQQFATFAVTMSWQLALVVLVPVLSGVELDKTFGTSDVYTLFGLALALVGSGVVMWRTMQAANRLPVPKLTTAQKRAVQKSYEEDDS
jgi:F0F1-type ATP synthase assembly protein I